MVDFEGKKVSHLAHLKGRGDLSYLGNLFSTECFPNQSPKPEQVPFPFLRHVFYIAAMLQVQVATGLQFV